MNKQQLLLQFYGIMLAVMTAIGCISYEKMIKAFSYSTVVLFVILSYLPFLILMIITNNHIGEDLMKCSKDKTLIWSCGIYILSGITSPLWYWITKQKGIIASSIFEIKYIVILSVLYIILGQNQLTTNTVVGIFFALLSVYFITK